jgi:serine/threonine-protein kinase
MLVVSSSQSASSIRLSGVWAQTLRLLWIAFTIMALFLLVISLPPHYQESLVVCDGDDCAFLNITTEEAQRYEELNITLELAARNSTIAGALSAIIFTIIGAVIYFSRPNEMIALMTAYALVAIGIAGPIDYLQSENIFWEIGLRIIQSTAVFGLAGFTFAFPNGRFTPSWTRWLFIIVIIACIVMSLIIIADRLEPADLIAILPPVIVVGAVSQIYRYLRVATQSERQQVKWVLGALALVTVIFSSTSIASALLALPRLEPVFLGWIGFTVLSLFPLSILLSILRYGLWDIDFYINRSVVYLSLTVVLFAVFAAIFFALQLAFNAIFGDGLLGLELIIPTAVVVGLFNPAKKRLRHFVDCRFYGIQLDYTQIIESRQRLLAEVNASTTIGQYRTTKLLGSGGMGEVYAAEDSQGQRVAIKVLLTQFERNEEMEKRFLREAQAAARLEHPNIVKILDAGEDSGRLFIAMEYVAGQDWSSLLRSGALPLEQVLPRLKELASALDYIHQHDIIHRDIKPSNVMIEAESNRAVLMDFGIAKIATEMTALTATSQIVGSLDYISPEQIQAQANIDYHADIYSFGVMTYQLLAGQLPFKKGNAGALVMAHLIQPPPDICDIKPNIPHTLSDAIQRAMAKQPHERFNSLSDFTAAMQV